jgi:hypothetical protein
VHVIAWDGSPESDEVGARPGDEPTELRLGFSRWPRAGEITVTILRSDVAFDVLHVRDPSIPNPLTHLPAGAYVVRAVQTSATGCRLASTTVRLASGRATEVELQPIDGAVVSGAAPLDGATVPREALVELVTGTHVDDVPLGGDGRFVAECVPANATTRVQLVRSGVAPSAAREVSTSPGFLELGLLGRAGGRAPLGLNVSPSPNGLVVVHVAPGSAADEVRIAPQDRIELIDGHSVAELARDEVRALLGSSRTLRLGLVDAQGRRRTAELGLGSP